MTHIHRIAVALLLASCSRSSPAPQGTAEPVPTPAPTPAPAPAITREQALEQAHAIGRRAAAEAARTAPLCERTMPDLTPQALRATSLAFWSQNCHAAPWCFVHTEPSEVPEGNESVSVYCSAVRVQCEEDRRGMRHEAGRISRCTATERLWCADFSASARRCFPTEETCQRHLALPEFRYIQRSSCTERPTWPGAADSSTRVACVPHLGYTAPGALESVEQTAVRVILSRDGTETPRRIESAFSGEFCGQEPSAYCYGTAHSLLSAWLHCAPTQDACETQREGEVSSDLTPCTSAPPQVWCLDFPVGRRCFADSTTCTRRAELAARAGAQAPTCMRRQTL